MASRLLLPLVASFATMACGPALPQALPTAAPLRSAATPEAAGARLFVQSGCGGCHTLNGLPGATGVAGPNLTNIALRPTLAGESIPNTPQTMANWLLDPAAVKPGATMPRVGLSEQQAEELAAFLFSQAR